LRVESAAEQKNANTQVAANASPPSWMAWLTGSLRFKAGMLVLLAVLFTGAIATHYVPHPVEVPVWTLIAALAALCVAGAAVFTRMHARPIRQLRERARQMLGTELAPGEGWAQARGEIGDLAEVLRHVTVANARALENRLTMVQQLQAILANASVGIMITRNGKFELVGRQLCQMFGYPESELIGQRTSTIYQSHQAYIDLGPGMRADLTQHGRYDGELVMRRKNGREFWVHMLGRAVIPGDTGGGTIWILEDISQAREAHEKLSWTATHDSLTGLVNRKEFEARLDLAMEQFNRQKVCVMFIDLDKFKAVNDNAGHAAGDEVLCRVAALFEAAVRQSDSVGRLGGDEFAILLPGCPLERAQGIAEQVRVAVDGYALQVEGRNFKVGTSIGLVEVTRDMPTIAAVIHAADSACYQAKRGGRNRVVTYAPAPVDAAEAGTTI